MVRRVKVGRGLSRMAEIGRIEARTYLRSSALVEVKAGVCGGSLLPIVSPSRYMFYCNAHHLVLAFSFLYESTEAQKPCMYVPSSQQAC